MEFSCVYNSSKRETLIQPLDTIQLQLVMFKNENVEPLRLGVLVNGFKKITDFQYDVSWIIDVMTQALHRAPVITTAINDVVNQLTVLAQNTVPRQHGKGGLAHYVGMDM